MGTGGGSAGVGGGGRRHRRKPVMAEINVTPMVDVMLVLLIIFMVITPMLQKGVSVDLAKVNSPEAMPDADKEDSLIVAITRDGRVYLGSNQIQVDQLTPQVKDKLERKTDKHVFVKADAHAKYGVVVDVVDAVAEIPRTLRIGSSVKRVSE